MLAVAQNAPSLGLHCNWDDIATQKAREPSWVAAIAKEAHIAALKTKSKENIMGHVSWPIFIFEIFIEMRIRTFRYQ